MLSLQKTIVLAIMSSSVLLWILLLFFGSCPGKRWKKKFLVVDVYSARFVNYNKSSGTNGYFLYYIYIIIPAQPGSLVRSSGIPHAQVVCRPRIL